MGDGAAMMLLAALIPAVSLAGGCASKPATNAPPERLSASAAAANRSMLEEAAALMTGSFSSARQAAEDPEFFDIRLEMVRIWEGRSDVPSGVWLYVEQARADMLDKPYRQRIYHVVARDDGRIVSSVYEIGTPPTPAGATPGASAASVWAGAWREPARFASLSPSDLVAREGCEVVLVRTEPGRFEGGTEGQNCLSTLRGATYATSAAIITASGLETWDRGYDAVGNQVWGAVKGGYRFERVK